MEEELTEQEKAIRAAAFLDGEGSIRISKFKGEIKNTQFKLHVSIFNTNPNLPEWLCKNFGGNIYVMKKPEGHKEILEWKVSDLVAQAFLLKIHRFLILKHKHALVALNFRFLQHELGGEDFYFQMKELNKKGKR